VAGSYDNEAIAIFLLMFTFFLWIRALKTGSAFWAALTALFYFYMVAAWGGYVFITNLLPLHAFILLLMGRYSSRLYVAYSTYYALGTLASMQIPFVGFQPVRTSEHMAALGIFGLLQLVAFTQAIRSLVPSKQFAFLLRWFIVAIFVLAFVALVGLTLTGTIAPWTGRFYSLWDTGYAKIHIPIIASVSEHQPTAWPSYFFDLNWLIWLFPGGVYLCFRQLKDEHVFVIVYAVLVIFPGHPFLCGVGNVCCGRRLIVGELFFGGDGSVDVDFDACRMCLRRNCRERPPLHILGLENTHCNKRPRRCVSQETEIFPIQGKGQGTHR
jgi:dolichyl-diphosphooligosaccharide---protein glycosyltransferase